VMEAEMYEKALARMKADVVDVQPGPGALGRVQTASLDTAAYVPAPAFFGESVLWMDDGEEEPATYSARCETRAEFVVLTKADILAVAASYPMVQKRFSAFRRGVLNMVSENAPEPSSPGGGIQRSRSLLTNRPSDARQAAIRRALSVSALGALGGGMKSAPAAAGRGKLGVADALKKDHTVINLTAVTPLSSDKHSDPG